MENHQRTRWSFQRDLDYDPQVVQIKDSKIIRLPETYKGNKLGHNWSISWVADEILGIN